MRFPTNTLRLRLVTIFLLLALTGKTAHAQETPKIEIAGTYAGISEVFGATCHGAAGSVAFNVNSWFGAVGEVSGCKGAESSGFFGSPARKWFTYLAGPRVSYRRTFTPYAHILFGGANLSRESSLSLLEGNAFAMSIGIGVDLRVNDRVSIRLVQPEYLRTDFGGVVREHLRLQTGVVFTLKK